MKALARLRRKFGDREYIRATEAGDLIGFSRPNTYKRHRCRTFPIPTYKRGGAVMVRLRELARYLNRIDRATTQRTNAMSSLRREEALSVLTTLQLAIIDLTAMREVEKHSLSPADLENAGYVIGMATVTSANLEHLLADNDYWDDALAARFMREATSFAASLNKEGLGFAH